MMKRVVSASLPFPWTRSPLFLSLLISVLLALLPGCDRGGGVVAFAVHPRRPEILYLSSEKGFFKSIDQGATWDRAGDGLGVFKILSIAVNPSMPSTLYVGTFSDGVYRSVDGGRNWTGINAGMKDYIAVVNALAIDPKNPTTLYAGTTMGIYKSLDNGGTWLRASSGLNSLFIVALAIDPQRPSSIYAGTSGGIYKSADGGESWAVSNNGLISDPRVNAMALGINRIVIDPERPDHLYIGTTTGLYRSGDKGNSWTKTGEGIEELFVTTVAFTRSDHKHVYAGTNKGLYRSQDEGTHWEKILSGEIRAIELDPLQSGRLYVATASGIFKGDGADWTAVGLPR